MKILRYEILSQPWLATLRKQWDAKLVLIFQFIGRPKEYYKKCINVLIFLVCIILFKGRIWGPSYFVSNPFSPDSHEVFPPEPFSSQYFNSIRSYLTVVSVQCKSKLHKLDKKMCYVLYVCTLNLTNTSFLSKHHEPYRAVDVLRAWNDVPKNEKKMLLLNCMGW